MPHICVSELGSIGSADGFVPLWREAISWTNVAFLSIGPLGTNFIEIWIKTKHFSFIKMHLKMLSPKWHPFCLGEMSYSCIFQQKCPPLVNTCPHFSLSLKVPCSYYKVNLRYNALVALSWKHRSRFHIPIHWNSNSSKTTPGHSSLEIHICRFDPTQSVA